MDKFTQLCAGCENSVEIRVNDHRDYYQTAEQFFAEQLAEGKGSMDEVVDPDIYKKCIETNNIVYVHFYPDTAISFYSFYHYDVEMALDLALEVLNDHRKKYGKS